MRTVSIQVTPGAHRERQEETFPFRVPSLSWPSPHPSHVLKKNPLPTNDLITLLLTNLNTLWGEPSKKWKWWMTSCAMQKKCDFALFKWRNTLHAETAFSEPKVCKGFTGGGESYSLHLQSRLSALFERKTKVLNKPRSKAREGGLTNRRENNLLDYPTRYYGYLFFTHLQGFNTTHLSAQSSAYVHTTCTQVNGHTSVNAPL